MTKNILPVAPTAAFVRASVKANPKALATLSDQAKANLDSRGRLADEVVAAFNKGKRAEKRYAQGNSRKAAALTAAERASLQAAGLAGKRGPLSKAAKAHLRNVQSKG